jgi:X-X-X-Leu-X-X-Gly heptad repeat protein
MFGMKTLVVGGGAIALLWMMNTHASAGDLVNNANNGASTVSNGVQSLTNGAQSLSNGLQGLASGSGDLQNVLHGDNGNGLSGPAVSINPSAARPGQQVLITVPTCIQPDSGTATSAVFTNNGSVSLTRNPQGAGLAGTATISSTAQNGSWSVNVTCGTGANKLNGVTSITIFGAVSPTNPPKAGGGGSVMKGDVGMTAGGIALVAGGVAYGVWTMRRRGADGTHAR